MTIAIDAHGTLLRIDDGTGSYTTIAEVTDIGGPSMSLDPIDVTSHDSIAAFREFIGGLLDAGEVTLTINYVPTAGTHDATTGLIADMVARVVRNFKLVFPDSGTTTWTFAALITAFESAEPIDDKLSADVTLKLSGQPTLV